MGCLDTWLANLNSFSLPMILVVAVMSAEPTDTLAQEPSKGTPAAIAEPERLVNSLANRNPLPKIMSLGGRVPLFDEKYDWKEQERVLDALEALREKASAMVWECLVEHTADERYFLTLGDAAQGGTEFGGTKNWTIGELCLEIANAQLVYPAQRAVKDIEVNGRQIDFEWLTEEDLQEWRKTRAERPFVELQIEKCHEAIDKLPTITDLPAQTKAECRMRLESQIEQLKKSKTGILDGFRPLWFPGERYLVFDAKKAGKIREEREQGQRQRKE